MTDRELLALVDATLANLDIIKAHSCRYQYSPDFTVQDAISALEELKNEIISPL